jgi:parallel beta-helix repeat protein
MRFHLVLLLTVSVAVSIAQAATINVPADQPTIQAGITVASKGDKVLVAPGTYTENINFLGKEITVTSSAGAATTIIDGGNIAPVATFSSGEGLKSILSHFTLQNGTSTSNSAYTGGGVYISGASPTIANNIIQKNSACSDGGGIGVQSGSPLIRDNAIKDNVQSGCEGGPGGGGIAVLGGGSAQIIGNKIQNNVWPSNGGGISLFDAGTPTIMNNIISNNSSGDGQGGGIWIVNESNALIVQNLFYGNTASQGGAIYLSVPDCCTGPILVNNTIVGGTGVTEGSAVWAGGFDNQVQFFNNLMIGLSGQNAVDCDSTYSPSPPMFTNNDAYSPDGSGLEGTCANESSENGNISLNPLFANSKNNFRLQSGSPAINSGDISAPDLPKKDLDGKPRTLNGTVDMGAYESQ